MISELKNHNDNLEDLLKRGTDVCEQSPGSEADKNENALGGTRDSHKITFCLVSFLSAQNKSLLPHSSWHRTKHKIVFGRAGNINKLNLTKWNARSGKNSIINKEVVRINVVKIKPMRDNRKMKSIFLKET